MGQILSVQTTGPQQSTYYPLALQVADYLVTRECITILSTCKNFRIILNGMRVQRRMVLSASSKNFLKNTRIIAENTTIPTPQQYLTSVAFVGALLCCGSVDGSISLWYGGDQNLQTHNWIYAGILKGHKNTVSCLCSLLPPSTLQSTPSSKSSSMSPSSVHRWNKLAELASGSFDNTINVWNLEQLTLLRTLKGHTLYVRSILFDCTNTGYLISCADDYTIKLWSWSTCSDTENCAATLTGHGSYVFSIALMQVQLL